MLKKQGRCFIMEANSTAQIITMQVTVGIVSFMPCLNDSKAPKDINSKKRSCFQLQAAGATRHNGTQEEVLN